MRHVIGFFLALAVAAGVFFGAGWGVWRFQAMQAGNGLSPSDWANTHNLLPLAALLGTGLVIGILFAVRAVSALAVGLPGLALIGWSALVLLRGHQGLTYIPMSSSHYAAGFSIMLSNGILLLLGAALIIPLFMPSRWRSREAEVEEFDEEFSTASSLVP